MVLGGGDGGDVTKDGTADGRAGDAPKPRGGEAHYRGFIGCAGRYDLMAASQFDLLTLGGLREGHHLLDIGCGSLRAGRLLIPYLAEGRYAGIEPERWLVQEGIEREVGADQVRLKAPLFHHVDDFEMASLARTFDYLLAHSIFSHASQAQIRRCCEQAHAVMGPKSLFYATFLIGDRDYDGTDWVYPELVPYTWRWIREAATAAGLHATQLDWHHPNKQRWVLLTRSEAAASTRRAGDPCRTVRRQAGRMRMLRTPGMRRLLAVRRGRIRGPASS